MLWLPTLGVRPSSVAVSDGSAAAIERSILSDSFEAAAGELAQAMLADGRLVLWVQELHGEPVRSIAELADWLAASFDRVLPQLCRGIEGAWQQLQEWDARGLAAGAIGASRQIDPAYSLHWRTTAIDYVARLIDRLKLEPCAWPDDGDPEFQHYTAADLGATWRLPRLIEKAVQSGRQIGETEARIRAERLEAMKELAYGASHEINNPLANISGRAQILLKGETDPYRRRMLAAIDSQALRAHEMISDLMHFARPPQLTRETLCIRTTLESVIGELASELSDRQISCEISDSGPCDIVFADSDQLCMAIRGIVQNAIEAIGFDGRIVITCRAPEPGEMLEVTIADTGRGIPEAIRSRLFDPFFSGREAGRGLGFGLARAWRILTDHGGGIELARVEGFSTTFRLRLPLRTTEV